MEKNSLKNLLIQDLGRFRDTSNIGSSKLGSITFFFTIFSNIIISSAFRSIFFYRLLNDHYTKNNNLSLLFKLIRIFSWVRTEIEIPYFAEMGGGLLLPHPKSVFINGGCINW